MHGEPHAIHRQILYDSIVYEVCRLTVTNETSYEFVVLTKATGVMRGLPIDGDMWKNTEENKTDQ